MCVCVFEVSCVCLCLWQRERATASNVDFCVSQDVTCLLCQQHLSSDNPQMAAWLDQRHTDGGIWDRGERELTLSVWETGSWKKDWDQHRARSESADGEEAGVKREKVPGMFEGKEKDDVQRKKETKEKEERRETKERIHTSESQRSGVTKRSHKKSFINTVDVNICPWSFLLAGIEPQLVKQIKNNATTDCFCCISCLRIKLDYRRGSFVGWADLKWTWNVSVVQLFNPHWGQ